jgi:hypothetical protein
MSNPINHHYVPQVYLKSFANSEKKVYQLKKSDKIISQRSISQICSEPNYFTIQKEETKLLNQITDPYYIEKHSFKKHENLYGRILKKLTSPSLNLLRLPRTEIMTFIEILVTIKRRNPTVKKMLMQNFLSYVNSEKFVKDMQPGIELSRQIDEIAPEAYLKSYIGNLNNDNSKVQDIYLTRFLGSEKLTVDSVITTLMKFKLYLCYAPPLSQFITSDNPGYLVVGNEIINYGGLSNDFAFVFPLTPKYSILIEASESDDKFNIDKAIYVRYLNTATVELYNEGTAKVAIDKVFSYSKQALENFSEKTAGL